MKVWRVGRKEAPTSLAPLHLYPWNNRFDDFNRLFRTLYCAQRPETCLREVLADFRMDTKTVSEFEKLFGRSNRYPFGLVTQIISRSVYDNGSVGIQFRSHLDNQPCYALYENRFKIIKSLQKIKLEKGLELLDAVCNDLGVHVEN